MELIVNGDSMSFDENITLLELIKKLSIEDRVMAAAVNMEIVKKEKWDERILVDGEKIELLDFVGGG